tara:strand:+ start:1541 stop:1765 length:225 start_codon:yes stop_codon:yes gene_type:complete
MKAKDFNIFKILEKTYNKMVYPFQTSGEFKDLPKTTIRQTEEKIPLASNVVDFIEERRKVYLNRGVKIVRSRSS